MHGGTNSKGHVSISKIFQVVMVFNVHILNFMLGEGVLFIWSSFSNELSNDTCKTTVECGYYIVVPLC